MSKFVVWTLAVGLVGACTTEDPTVSTMEDLVQHHQGAGFIPNNFPIPNHSGWATTFSTQGRIDLGNEFFQDLGTNGRRCVTCHMPTAGWGITPEQVQLEFALTSGGVIDDGLGLGAIFRTNDGATSPNADISTYQKRRQAFSMLLNHGVIRVGMPMPANADFDLIAVDDPYGYASANELSLFRRPLPATNLKFLSAVMWDGRETFSNESIHFDLSQQATDATQGHAQGDPLTDEQRESIVNFEASLHTAQEWDEDAGSLHAYGAQGGTYAVVDQVFYLGINDLFGDSQTGADFDPVVFDIYDSWNTSHDNDRAAVARGQKIFNTKTFAITGVSGINDEAAFGSPASVVGTCTTCHNAPNAGDHSVSAPLDIGIVAASRRAADMPLYTFKQHGTGAIKAVTDPGRALVTGRFKDIGRFKGPILRGLATRAPYFHDGSADSLEDAVDFYNDRFHIGLSNREKSDLAAFLRTL